MEKAIFENSALNSNIAYDSSNEVTNYYIQFSRLIVRIKASQFYSPHSFCNYFIKFYDITLFYYLFALYSS